MPLLASYYLSDTRDGRAITCLRCGRTSHNPEDVRNRYCGNCHFFHDDERDGVLLAWRTMDIEARCKTLRADIATLLGAVRAIRDQATQAAQHRSPTSAASDHSEIIANAMLAFRHLEDARMRLGKVIQAHDGGKSCYPS